MDVNGLRRGLLGAVAGRQQYEIITIQQSTHLGGDIAGHFDQYAEPTGYTYFLRLSPYDDTLSMLVMAIYKDGVLQTTTGGGCLRRRGSGDFGMVLATDTYAMDVKAGDRYIKVVEEA